MIVFYNQDNPHDTHVICSHAESLLPGSLHQGALPQPGYICGNSDATERSAYCRGLKNFQCYGFIFLMELWYRMLLIYLKMKLVMILAYRLHMRLSTSSPCIPCGDVVESTPAPYSQF